MSEPAEPQPDWSARRRSIADRWPQDGMPMTRFEMTSAIEWDAIATNPKKDAYHRRGLLNAVAFLMDELDAAREAAATSAREEPTGLREALGLMAARWEQTIATIEHEGDERPALAKTTRIQASSRRACLDDLRAALSRGTAEPEAGLDVDRLTRAMDAADPPVDGTPDDELHAEHLAYAKEIAAEYARLAPAPADGEEPE